MLQMLLSEYLITYNMNKLLFLLAFLFGFCSTHGQVLGKTVTEDYTAGFEKQASVYQIPEYDGMPVPVAILSIGVNEQVLEQLEKRELLQYCA